MESWREVECKGVTWIVSNCGNVRVPALSCEYERTRNGKKQIVKCQWPERSISPCKTRTGYLEVAVKIGPKRIKVLLHRLVGIAFVPGYRDDLTINHINGKKTDNRPENLEWVSLARNSQHAWEIGLVDLRGELQPNAKLTSKRVTYIRRLLAQGVPAHTLAVVAGVSQSLITMIRDGKRWPTVTSRKSIAR